MKVDLDLAPVANAALHREVPVIDLCQERTKLVMQVGDACREWGFFQVVGHSIGEERVAEVIATARAFFSRPHEEKRRYLRSRENPWGYYDRELTKEQRDRKEIFDIGPDLSAGSVASDDPFQGPTPSPAQPASFTAVMRAWFEDVNALSAMLVDLIAESLTNDAGVLQKAFEPNHTSYLRLNFYPVEDALRDEHGSEADLGIHHHTDAGALTVLLQDGVGGLQVFRDGHWHDVHPAKGAFTINIGDMMQVWSNDAYRAPVHRVLAMDRDERISIPYFYNPSYNADVAPLSGEPAYEPINWGEFRRRRADGDFADYGTEVQISQYRR